MEEMDMSGKEENLEGILDEAEEEVEHMRWRVCTLVNYSSPMFGVMYFVFEMVYFVFGIVYKVDHSVT